MKLFDTHCHVHEATLKLKATTDTKGLWVKFGSPDPEDILKQADDAGVIGMICVGTTVEDSVLAVDFVQGRPNVWASIGVHPHEAKDGFEGLVQILEEHASGSLFGSAPRISSSDKQSDEDAGKANSRGETKTAPAGIVAIGECGLDYFYTHSPKVDQVKALRFQIELALKYGLPMIFHVRDAFDDFWPVFDEYKGIRGVVHSFTDDAANLGKILERGLSVGVNGIATFTKNDDQLQVYRSIPLDKLLLETDSPFLTPAPLRGRVNVPANVSLVAEFLAKLRNESLQDLTEATTRNALTLFKTQ